MRKSGQVVNLDDFRHAAQIKKKEAAMDANFTADERRDLQAAFEFGRSIGAFAESQMDSNRKMSFFQIHTTGNKATLSASKRSVLGEFKYAADIGHESQLMPHRGFKEMISAIYDYAREIAPPKNDAPSQKL